MIPERLLNRALTWIEPTLGTDAYGDSEETWGAGTAITGRIDTMSLLEVQDQTRDMATTVRVLFTNTTGLTSKARIVDGTITYEVDGLPTVVDSPAGPHHTEARLRLVGG